MRCSTRRSGDSALGSGSCHPCGSRADYTPELYFQEAEARVFSWTWNVPEDRLAAAVDTTRAWAQERFGSLDAVLEPRYPMVWRAYDVPA